MATVSFEEHEIKGLVSVVIPTYRGDRFISEALESVSCQTDPHWEVIVVEDGSRGATQKIVEDFARRHPSHRISYSRNERNCGPSHARNVAFSKIRGEFVALLDADDRWFPDYLSISLQSLQASNHDLVYSTALMIEDQTDLLVGVWGPQGHDLMTFPNSLFRRNFITPSATVLRRAVLVDVGAWDTQLHYCEDLDFWLRCVAAGKKFQHVSGCHCVYRRNHEEAATSKTCAVNETFAQVVERYVQLPGLREKWCRKYAHQAYLQAAQFHRTIDPLHDSSADRSRSARLMLHAWRLRPKRVEYLFKGAMLGAVDLFRRRKRRAPARTSALVAETSARAAA